jgi:hypothetical protein
MIGSYYIDMVLLDNCIKDMDVFFLTVRVLVVLVDEIEDGRAC